MTAPKVESANLNLFLHRLRIGSEADEYGEMADICKKEGKGENIDELLEEKLAPLRTRLSDSRGQLVAALTRHFEQASFDTKPIVYLTRESLHAGIITEKTSFPYANQVASDSFLLDIKNSCSIRNVLDKTDFVLNEDKNFSCSGLDWVRVLYLMDRPPKVPMPDGEGYETRPRLELYIGNNEVVPFLEREVTGWQYMQLKNILKTKLPVSKEIKKRVLDEQFNLYEKVCESECKLRQIIGKRNARTAVSEANDGMIVQEGYAELTDEVSEIMAAEPNIKEAKYNLDRALETAIMRGYHEHGKVIQEILGPGVVKKIDIKKFFSEKKREYKLS